MSIAEVTGICNRILSEALERKDREDKEREEKLRQEEAAATDD